MHDIGFEFIVFTLAQMSNNTPDALCVELRWGVEIVVVVVNVPH